MHYVIGDVHGCYDEMMALLAKIEEKDPKAKIIFLGDFVDRGKDVWKVLEWAHKNVNRPGSRYRSVMGNHEDMLIDWFNNLIDEHYFYPPANYRFDIVAQAHCKNTNELAPYIAWMKAMPNYIDIGNFRIVHAWSCFIPNERQDINLWDRKCSGNYMNDKIIVHGHTPTATEEFYNNPSDRKGMICYRHNAINLDGGAVFNGYGGLKTHLCGICLETLEEFYNDCDFDGHSDVYREEMIKCI